jgi:hypothetical protein
LGPTRAFISNQLRQHIFITVNIGDKGTVDLLFNDRPTTEWISEIMYDDEIGWEIETEVRDIIFDRILRDLDGRFLLRPTIDEIRFIPT